MRMTPPEAEAVAAFGGRGGPVRLAGKEGVSFRVHHLVMKKVSDAGEAEWTQELLSRVEQDGFRIAEPVAAIDGRWVHDGWIANRFVDGLRPAAPAWAEIIDAGLRFGDAAERVRDADDDVLSRRTHRWAIADRVAWDEQQVELRSEAAYVHAQLRRWVETPTRRDNQLVHADLSGNVFVDQAGTAVILDVSPYLRPKQWAAAIVIADAVLWSGADVGLARSFTTEAKSRDLFARALIFRLVAEQLADDPRHGALLEPYRSVVATVLALGDPDADSPSATRTSPS